MIATKIIGVDRVLAKLERAGVEMDRAEMNTVRQGSIILRRALVQHLSGRAPSDPFWGKGSPSGAFMGARTGQSRSRLSPGGLAVKQGNRWSAAVGSPDKHVAFQEQGGTIQGRQFLRIPTRAAQTAGGMDRNAGRSIRDIPGSFLMRSRAGNLWAAVRASGDSVPTLLYMLVRSVTQRARGIFATVRREIEPQIAALGRVEVAAVVRHANG